jgi:hypothetical protein
MARCPSPGSRFALATLSPQERGEGKHAWHQYEQLEAGVGPGIGSLFEEECPCQK